MLFGDVQIRGGAGHPQGGNHQGIQTDRKPSVTASRDQRGLSLERLVGSDRLVAAVGLRRVAAVVIKAECPDRAG